ncbi:MAG: DUF4236 domain-containing protein [Phycisphaerales bacterium]
MGLYFRRSMNLGPFRVNVSRSGVGWSVGGRGLRVGQSSRGRRYTTISAPGTGLGYRSSSRGCVVAIAALGGAPLVAFLLARAAWPLI